MTFAILGLGTALPENRVGQEQARQIARRLCCRTDEQASWLQSIYEHAGVHSRNIVFSRALVRDVLEGTRASGSVFLPSGGPDDRGPTTAERLRQYAQDAGPLALESCRGALARAGLAPGAITHLVTVSCTGFQAPGVDIELIGRLGLPAGTQRTHVGYMGCHGALNGLRVAGALAGSDPGARILLCAVELCSLHYYYQWDPQKVVANALFADGAAAVAGAAAGPPAAWRLAASGSCLFPDSEGAMTWTVSDHGFVMTLSRQVPALIAARLRPWLTDWLGRQGVALAEIGSWAVHPGGPKILDAVEDALGLPPSALEVSRAVLAACGNMSSPTVLFILDRLAAREAPRPCVALGFGPGLTVEAALFR